jgi:non-ribosomal peptide synthetase component E (peptide arylation enzyme)
VQVALIPKPDELLGERICAVLAMRAGASVTVQELGAFLEHRKIAKMRRPEHVVIMDELPMTPTKKVIKRKLFEQLFCGSGHDAERLVLERRS